MTEQELNNLILEELKKTQKANDYRVFQKPLEIELMSRIAEKKDSNPMSSALFTLYSEMKHIIISLAEENERLGGNTVRRE